MSSSSNPSAIAQRRRSSFANSNRATPKIQPLSREYFSSLIKLETDFHSNSYTVETLDDLVQLYARAVEYYDSIHDHISSYFTYKIQDILATKKSLKMLIQRKQTEKSEKTDQKEESQKPTVASNPLKSVDTNRKDVIRESLGEDSSDEEGEKDRREQWEKKKENKKSSQSLASLKWQKQRFAQFYHKVETEKDSYQQDMHVVFSNYTSTSNDNDSVIKRAISSQKQRVKQRIEQRKNNSFLSHTLNNTFNTNPGFNDENILKDLEDAPEVNNKDSMTPLLKKHIKNLIASKRESSKSNEQRDIATGKEEEGQVGEKLSTENSFTLNEANPNANETEILNSEALKLS